MAKAQFRVSRAASEVEYTALELIRQAEVFDVSVVGYALKSQRKALLEAARNYSNAVRLAARVR